VLIERAGQRRAARQEMKPLSMRLVAASKERQRPGPLWARDMQLKLQ
jgi:hypothetical protein